MSRSTVVHLIVERIVHDEAYVTTGCGLGYTKRIPRTRTTESAASVTCRKCRESHAWRKASR